MNVIEGIYFFYMFVALYFLALTLSLYFHNRKRMSTENFQKVKKSLSILIPAFNEEKTIANTIKAIFKTDYEYLKEVIVINDGSTDGTLEKVKSLLKKFPKLKVISKANSGKADSLNYGWKRARGDFVAIIDADSYPDKFAFSKMMSYFVNEKVGVVTASCTPLNRETLLERLQSIEYKVIAFTRKLLEFIDSIYVAPGSLSIYRKVALAEIGGFDKNNLTEDIESTWHLLEKNWKVRMCFDATVKTTVPNKIKAWWTQRVRWTVGGFQVLSKYIKYLFRREMFGYFVIPFFAFGLTIGLAGLGISMYLIIGKLLNQLQLFLFKANSNIILFSLSEMNLSPSVLNYFGILLFVLFLLFTFFVLWGMKDKVLKNENIFEIIIYMTLYLVTYPFMISWSIYKWIKGGTKWR